MSEKKYHLNSKADTKRMLDEAIEDVRRIAELLYHYDDDPDVMRPAYIVQLDENMVLLKEKPKHSKRYKGTKG
jgi:hypothetical protein